MVKLTKQGAKLARSFNEKVRCYTSKTVKALKGKPWLC